MNKEEYIPRIIKRVKRNSKLLNSLQTILKKKSCIVSANEKRNFPHSVVYCDTCPFYFILKKDNSCFCYVIFPNEATLSMLLKDNTKETFQKIGKQILFEILYELSQKKSEKP